MSTDIKSLGSFVWSIAELLRGDFKQSEYGKVIRFRFGANHISDNPTSANTRAPEAPLATLKLTDSEDIGLRVICRSMIAGSIR